MTGQWQNAVVMEEMQVEKKGGSSGYSYYSMFLVYNAYGPPKYSAAYVEIMLVSISSTWLLKKKSPILHLTSYYNKKST